VQICACGSLRSVQCSGKHPVCQRCSVRGLICRYTNASSRGTKQRNVSRIRQYNPSPATYSSEVEDGIPPVQVTTTIVAPQPIRPSNATPGLSIVPRAAVSQRWIPSTQPMSYNIPHSGHQNETHSALGLTGVSTKPPSTITAGFPSQDFGPRATKNGTPTRMSMFNQYSPTNFNIGQRMPWDYRTDQTNG
jgi:hypothetical protein